MMQGEKMKKRLLLACVLAVMAVSAFSQTGLLKVSICAKNGPSSGFPGESFPFSEKSYGAIIYDASWGYIMGRGGASGPRSEGSTGYIGGLPVGKVYVNAGASFSHSMYPPDAYDMWRNAWCDEYYDNAYDHSGAVLVDIVDSDTTSITIDLVWTSFISVGTSPKPFPLSVDGAPVTPPKLFEWRQGESHTLGVDEYADVSGEDPPRFFFKEWSNGGGRVQNYTVPAPLFCRAADSPVAYFDNYKTVVIATNPRSLPLSVDGAPYDAPHAFRWKPSGSHSIGVEDTVEVSGDPTRYVFREWRHGGSRIQDYTVPAPTAGHVVDSLVARFDRYSKLELNSKYGHPLGTGWHKTWAEVSFSVEDSVIEYSDHTFRFPKPSDPAEKDSLLHLFDGWEGLEGHLTYSGKDNPAKFTIYGKTVEKALWRDQYPLVVSSGDTSMGAVSATPPGLWHDRDSTVTLKAVPKTGHRFLRWEGSISDTVSLVNVKMDTSKKITAVFEEITGNAVRPAPVPSSGKPVAFRLYPNFPNPFNPETEIRFDVPVSERVRIEVFSLTGKRVAVLADCAYGPGTYQVRWKGTDVYGKPAGSGIYFCRMSAGGFMHVSKMHLIR
jgi:hypothetical protein